MHRYVSCDRPIMYLHFVFVMVKSLNRASIRSTFKFCMPTISMRRSFRALVRVQKAPAYRGTYRYETLAYPTLVAVTMVSSLGVIFCLVPVVASLVSAAANLSTNSSSGYDQVHESAASCSANPQCNGLSGNCTLLSMAGDSTT
jgi:hypothetical protein